MTRKSLLHLVAGTIVGIMTISVFVRAEPDVEEQLRSGSKKQAVETGTVSWLRSYDEAAALSKKSGKPVFALFQEVPG